jgi:hypothetical protein
VDLVICFKEESPRWSYKKIRDQVGCLGYNICKSSVKNILIEHGYDPEPDLTVRAIWHEFIKRHWDANPVPAKHPRRTLIHVSGEGG